VTVNPAGTLAGSGTVHGSVIGDGRLAPGNSPGLIHIDGDYTQSSTSVLEVEVGGLTPGTLHDQVVVGGATTLAGHLEVPIVNVAGHPAFVPQINDEITFLTSAGGVSGKFDTLTAPHLNAVSSLAIKVFKTVDQKEVHLKFVAPTNVVFTDTHDANWQNNISWSTTTVPESDNIVIVQNNAIGGDQRVDVQTENAFTDQLVVSDPDAIITVGVKDGRSLSAVIGDIAIGQHAAIELGTAGNTSNKGTLVTPLSVTIQDGGILAGNGTVQANSLVVSNGVLRPGYSVGHVNVDGNYQQAAGGKLLVDVNGTASEQYDTIDVTGSVQLSGKLEIDASSLGNFTRGQPIPILTAGSLTGEFDSVEWTGNNNVYFKVIYNISGSGAAAGGGASVGAGVSLEGFDRGDMNGRDGITPEDFELFAFGLMNPSTTKFFAKCNCEILPQQGGDFSGNGRLDFDDIAGFQSQVGGMGLSSDGLMAAIDRYLNPVPEPASALLLLAGSCFLAIGRSRPSRGRNFAKTVPFFGWAD
jgi:hypothetical protein